MIRNVVVGVLKDGVTPEQARVALDVLGALQVEGVDFRMDIGLDLGLREGNASYALTADFVDEEAYRRYDADEEHNRIRRELIAPISASITRIQFRV